MNQEDKVDKIASRVFNVLFLLTLLLWPFAFISALLMVESTSWEVKLFVWAAQVYPFVAITSSIFSYHFRKKNMIRGAFYFSIIPLPIWLYIIGILILAYF